MELQEPAANQFSPVQLSETLNPLHPFTIHSSPIQNTLQSNKITEAHSFKHSHGTPIEVLLSHGPPFTLSTTSVVTVRYVVYAVFYPLIFTLERNGTLQSRTEISQPDIRAGESGKTPSAVSAVKAITGPQKCTGATAQAARGSYGEIKTCSVTTTTFCCSI